MILMEITSSADSNKTFRYLSFFDLDRTITGKISGKELTRHAWKTGHMSWGNLLKALGNSLAYRLKIRNPVRIADEMVRWTKGMSVETMERLSVEVFRNVLLPSVHAEAIPEIRFHKENNAGVVILSSSIAPLCKKIADYLEADGVICSELEIKKGLYTGRPEGPLCFGKEKVVKLKEYCARHNADPVDAWYYGDSISDLPVLGMVGNPVCVNPDKRLLRQAAGHQWKICYW